MVPPEKHDRFIDAIEKCAAVYIRIKNQKSPLEVEKELQQIKVRVRRCLRLLDRKPWRPSVFGKDLRAISVALARLSPQAHEYLEFRNVRVVKAIPARWRAESSFDVVVDPICFQSEDEQFEALKLLLGALSGPVAMEKGRGRREVNAERTLYHSLAVAFTRDTGKAASDRSPKFMAVCEEIKLIYQLTDWRPGSLARSARLLRAREE
jgi:hypothetical protein